MKGDLKKMKGIAEEYYQTLEIQKKIILKSTKKYILNVAGGKYRPGRRLQKS